MTHPDLFPAEDVHLAAWEPTHEAAAHRLSQFIPRAGSAYARQRNFDFGPDDRSNVSALSPWIRHRLLLEEDVIDAVLRAQSFSNAEKFVQEVFWRGYFKGWLEQRPQVWQAYRQSTAALIYRLETDASLAQRYEDATSGQTGIACFDAWACELTETGYLHNHARMWFSSIWMYTLQLPWELGADYFYRHLLDGDPASNTCSWRWVGGLHTLGKTYLARASNIEKYTGGRFNPAGELASDAPPLGEGLLPDRTPLSFEAPTLHGQRAGFILTEEDCSAHTLSFEGEIVAALALCDFTPRSILASPDHVQEFAPKAVAAAAAKLEADRGVEVSRLTGREWDVALQEWARLNELDVMVTARLPLGPVKRRLMKAARGAAVPLVEVTRPYDRLVWPHAKAGFFGLKKKIPQILKQLESA